MENAAKPSGAGGLAQSGWFWLAVFLTAGLALTFVVTPKYNARQGQIERQFHARQVSASGAADDGPQAAAPGKASLITLFPLRVALGILCLIAWGALAAQWLLFARCGSDSRTVRSAEPAEHDLAI